MPERRVAVTFDAHEPARVAQFWAAVLGREVLEDLDGAYLPGTDTQVGLRFVPSASQKVGPNHLHLHLTSTSLDDQEQTVAAALGRGATHLDVGQRPEEGHVVLADPGGNEFCVIEPGNSYLAGCGFLAEVACDGSREVGLFWSAALGWPLVWDDHGETAIQSPHGGTKIAWGGPAEDPPAGPNRQRLTLTVHDGDREAEVERLVSLGATRLAAGGGSAIALADPDGHEFSVVAR